MKKTNRKRPVKGLIEKEKEFKVVQISSILISLIAALVPLTLDFSVNKKVLIELTNKPIFWAFLILLTLLIVSITLLPIVIKKYFKKSNKKAVLLKKEIITTYLNALENSNLKPDFSTKHFLDD